MGLPTDGINAETPVWFLATPCRGGGGMGSRTPDRVARSAVA
jgi:hypothetical protein